MLDPPCTQAENISLFMINYTTFAVFLLMRFFSLFSVCPDFLPKSVSEIKIAAITRAKPIRIFTVAFSP